MLTDSNFRQKKNGVDCSTAAIFMLPGQTVVKCKYLDHLFDHDVAAPEDAVKYIHDYKTGNLFAHKQKMFYLEVSN